VRFSGSNLINFKSTNKMPETNKCDLCGLKVRIIGESKLSDTDFVALHQLKDQNLITKRFSRNIYTKIQLGETDIKEATGFFDFCAVGSKKWNKNDKKCSYWQLKLDEIKLSDHLSIFNSQKISQTSIRITLLAIGISSLILLNILYKNFFE
jgi:hypothetical protein